MMTDPEKFDSVKIKLIALLDLIDSINPAGLDHSRGRRYAIRAIYQLTKSIFLLIDLIDSTQAQLETLKEVQRGEYDEW